MKPKLRFGEFTDEWQVKKLSELCEMKAGKFIAAGKIKPQQKPNQYQCYGGNGVRGFVDSYNHEGSYSLIGRQGALCGNVTYVSGKFYATEHAVVVAPEDHTDNKWLHYQLKRLNLNRFATGQAQPGLSVDTILAIKQLNPSQKVEQQKIAGFLTVVDERVELMQKRIDLLKKYKKGMMQKIFTQKIRFKDEKGNNFPAWQKKKFGDFTYINPKVSDLPDNFTYIDLESVHEGKLLHEKQMKKIMAPSRAQRLLEKGDILFQTVRPYQRNNFFFNLEGQYVASTGYAQIRVELPRFIYHLIHTDNFVNSVLDYCTGTNYPAINSSDLSKILINIPESKEEQQKIADFLTSLDDKIKAEEDKLAQAKLFKKGLLQRMFV